MSKRRIIEWVKTTAIALLLALAVFLGAKTELFNDFFQSIPIFSALVGVLKDSQTPPPPVPGAILSEAARPAVIVITDALGGHHGIRYDTGALSRAYERTSTLFGEALGSATPPREIGEDEWRVSLGSPGVYFEYQSPVGLNVLAGWLGVRPAEGLGGYAIRRACVTFDGGINTMYFESGGAFYSCETATPGGRPSGLEGYIGNDALFAFETGIACPFAPYTLLLPETAHPVLLSDITMTAREMIDAVLPTIGVTGQLESSYMKRGDTLLFIGQTVSVTITVLPGGRVTLHAASGILSATPGDEGQMIERARVVVAGTVGRAPGDAQVYFDAIETVGDEVTVTFRYHAAGGIVHLYEDGYAAKITFTNGAVTEMELIFRAFSDTGETVTLLPERQTLAAAGSEFVLCYPDTGGGYLRPVWVALGKEEA